MSNDFLGGFLEGLSPSISTGLEKYVSAKHEEYKEKSNAANEALNYQLGEGYLTNDFATKKQTLKSLNPGMAIGNSNVGSLLTPVDTYRLDYGSTLSNLKKTYPKLDDSGRIKLMKSAQSGLDKIKTAKDKANLDLDKFRSDKKTKEFRAETYEEAVNLKNKKESETGQKFEIKNSVYKGGYYLKNINAEKISTHKISSPTISMFSGIDSKTNKELDTTAAAFVEDLNNRKTGIVSPSPTDPKRDIIIAAIAKEHGAPVDRDKDGLHIDINKIDPSKQSEFNKDLKILAAIGEDGYQQMMKDIADLRLTWKRKEDYKKRFLEEALSNK